MTQRDRRALMLLGGAVAVFAVVNFAWRPSSAPAVVAANTDSIAAAEKRLELLRTIESTIPGQEALLKRVSADAAEREKALLQAETAALAQAQLLGILRRVAGGLAQPVEFSSVELSQKPEKLGEDYGEVFVTVNFAAHIEDLVNLLAEITAQPEAIATRDLRIQHPVGADPKKKVIAMRLTVAGAVPKNLVPQKKVAF